MKGRTTVRRNTNRRVPQRATKKIRREEYDQEDHDQEPPSTTILEGVKKVGGRKRRGHQELKPTGMTLAVKFSLAISIATALLCVGAGLFNYGKTTEFLLAEIDRKGASVVKSLAGMVENYYREFKEADKAFRKAEKDRNEEEREKYHTKKKEIRDRYQEQLDHIVSFYVQDEGGKEKIFSEEILNVTLNTTKDGTVPPLQNGRATAETLVGTPRELEEVIDGIIYPSLVQVVEGTIKLKSGGLKKVKAYSQEVIKDKVSVLVILSESNIEMVFSDLWFIILVVTLVSIGVGSGVSFVLASHVTKPVRKLLQDIDIVANGNLNHQTKTTSNDEIGVLAASFNGMTKNLRVAHKTELKSELDRQAREHEMGIATEIQTALLPSEIPKISGYDISAFYRPSKEVGGDYYDVIQYDEKHIGFIVADVSGKGIPGSMVMTMARSLFRMEAFRNNSPSKVFTEVNKVLAEDIRKGMFVSAMYAFMNIETGELWISSAGHNPAVIVRAATGQRELIGPKGIAWGLAKSTIFSRTITEEKHQLNRGDRIMLYTDGVPEAMDPNNEEFGDDRFYDWVTRNAKHPSEPFVNALVRTLEDWKQDAIQSDDITIVTWKRL